MHDHICIPLIKRKGFKGLLLVNKVQCKMSSATRFVFGKPERQRHNSAQLLPLLLYTCKIPYLQYIPISLSDMHPSPSEADLLGDKIFMFHRQRTGV